MIARLAMASIATLFALGGSQAFAQPAAPPAKASATAELTVYQIRASNEDKPSDAELTQGQLGKKLSKGPFKSWKRFTLISPKQSQTVQQLKAVEAALATGKLGVLYRSRSQAQGKKDRLRLSITMDDQKGKRTLDTTIELDSTDFFLVGGQPLGNDATFILAISVR
jgi:hypothetical protein